MDANTPYPDQSDEVEFHYRQADAQKWRKCRADIAKLLAGEMPHDIEDVFAACKLTLFPRIARRFSRRPAAVRTGRTPASTSPPSTTSSPNSSTRTRS